MQIEIKQCNNIEHGNVEIRENTLNIKYGINGTGKSTIARAIVASLQARQEETNSALISLKPFKYLNDEDVTPIVSGDDAINRIKIFDEQYINEFVFQPDELLKGSFDIFVRDEQYVKGMAEIDALVAVMQKTLAEDKDIGDLIADFGEISASFGRPAKKGLHGSSPMAKALKGGNKVSNVPTGLEPFKHYIQHSENYRWVKWQFEGQNYFNISTDCPFCTADIQKKRDTIKKVSEVYDPKSIENLNKIISVFQRLNKYFSDSTNHTINGFVTNIDGYADDQVIVLREVKDQIDRLNQKFISAQRLGFSSLKDVETVKAVLSEHKINVDLFIHLKSESTYAKAKIVNDAIDKLIDQAGQLQGSINKQKKLIEKLVRENSKGINDFLRNAGYNYKACLIEDEAGQHKLKLVHNDMPSEIDNAKAHLSYGERNAFALILFMYDAIKCNADLIVLDDPISSFDKNKKYAIVEMLFRKGNSFDEKTVLMLTHDLDPIVDILKHHSDRFKKPFATFLENHHGVLTEKEISKTDISTYIQIIDDNLNIGLNDISKLVYLRRLCEVTGNKDIRFQLISNLFHKRTSPIIRIGDITRDMTEEEFHSAEEQIREDIPTFNYQTLLQLVMDDEEMYKIYEGATNNYEKLHIYRIIFDGKLGDIESTVIQKFINEAFHIENDYIYQLNPSAFQLVPQYVIDECDKHAKELLKV